MIVILHIYVIIMVTPCCGVCFAHHPKAPAPFPLSEQVIAGHAIKRLVWLFPGHTGNSGNDEISSIWSPESFTLMFHFEFENPNILM